MKMYKSQFIHIWEDKVVGFPQDVEAVPMPDGELCLLALPPECSQGEGPASMQYLKLCSRYITDRKVSVPHFYTCNWKNYWAFEELSKSFIVLDVIYWR